MLSRLKVRTKLLVILLPLLVGVGVLGAIGVLDRAEARQDAVRSVDLGRAIDIGTEATHHVQLEQMLATGVQAGLLRPSGFADQQLLTDEALTRLRNILPVLSDSGGTIDGRSMDQIANDLRRQIDEVPKARDLLNPETGSVAAVADAYSSVVDGLHSVNASLVQTVGASGGVAPSSHWFFATKATDARLAADVLALIGATEQGRLAEVAWAIDEIPELVNQSQNFIEVYTTDAGDFGRQTYDQMLQDESYQASQAAVVGLGVIDLEEGIALEGDWWLGQMTNRLEAQRVVESELVKREVDIAEFRFEEADRGVRLFVGGAGTALILAMLLALSAARSISAAVRRLTGAAREISEEQLPRLVDSLNNPQVQLDVRATDIDVHSNDEFGELANAFRSVEAAAIDVAAEQGSALRKGISDIFVNLARRNQALLDRQIEFIDRLESNEEDPDQLENLFRLDHLATRMRRNAESLLVLAGAEGPRRRSRDVSVTDAIRVAVGEVEDFARITLLAVDEANAQGGAAVDLAHLLSELMENGTQYSPPDRRVEVVGHCSNDGGYVVSISDHGVGMSAEALAEANELLATPPALGLEMSRSLGFVVVSILASRHGIGVKLTDSPSGGVTALVSIPPRLMVQPETSILDEIPEGPIAAPQAAPDADWMDSGPGSWENTPLSSATTDADGGSALMPEVDWMDATPEPAAEVPPLPPSVAPAASGAPVLDDFTAFESVASEEPAAEGGPELESRLPSPKPSDLVGDGPAPMTPAEILGGGAPDGEHDAPSQVGAPPPANWMASTVETDDVATGGLETDEVETGDVEPAEASEEPAVAEFSDAPKLDIPEGETPTWSAEVVSSGPAEDVPTTDQPMGAAFEAGLFALLPESFVESIAGADAQPSDDGLSSDAGDRHSGEATGVAGEEVAPSDDIPSPRRPLRSAECRHPSRHRQTRSRIRSPRWSPRPLPGRRKPSRSPTRRSRRETHCPHVRPLRPRRPTRNPSRRTTLRRATPIRPSVCAAPRCGRTVWDRWGPRRIFRATPCPARWTPQVPWEHPRSPSRVLGRIRRLRPAPIRLRFPRPPMSPLPRHPRRCCRPDRRPLPNPSPHQNRRRCHPMGCPSGWPRRRNPRPLRLRATPR